MTKPDYTWEFEENRSGEVRGDNNLGITHFTGKRATAVVREAIQNSLDARSDPSQPVVVKFYLRKMSPDVFGGDDLRKRIEWCLESKTIANDDDAESRLKHAHALLRAPMVQVLEIGDENTTGASDDSRSGISPWEALTRSQGVSVKGASDATGSYGIGKFAPYVATPLQTVLYSTAYTNKQNELSYRAMGKTIQVSHIGPEEKKYHDVGYLGNEFNSWEDSDVPEEIKRKTQGTSIFILGYNFGRSISQWRQSCHSVLVNNFFHALIDKGLEVRFEDWSIQRDNSLVVNSENFDSLGFPISRRTSRFLRVSKFDVFDSQDFDGVGNVRLRIEVGETPGYKRIALVRDAGMLITSKKENMSLGNLSKPLPPNWKSFTAIVEIKSAKDGLLRRAESPGHDLIRSDYVSSIPEEREKAELSLRKVGEWLFKTIEEKVCPNPSDRSSNISELSGVLPLSKDDGFGTDTGNGESSQDLNQPFQRHGLPRRRRISGVRQETDTTGNDGPSGGRTTGRGSGGGSSGYGNSRGGPSTSSRESFESLRFCPHPWNRERGMRLYFDLPSRDIKEMRVYEVNGDGNNSACTIVSATLGGERLQVKKGRIVDISRTVLSTMGERPYLDIILTELVANKSFDAYYRT